MELDELKNLWKAENEKMKERIKLNEALIKKGYLDKTVGEFDILLKTSLLGSEYFGKSDHLFRKGQYLGVSVMICTAPAVVKFDGIKVLDFLRVSS